MLHADSVQKSRKWSSSPLHRSKRHGIPSGRSSVKHHSSERRELSVRTPICVQKLRTVPSCIRSKVSTTRPNAHQCSTSKMISLQNTNMERQQQTVRTSGLHRPYAILDKASLVEDVQPSGRQSTLSGRSDLIMKITCSRSATVRTLAQYRPDAALFRKE
jgi:hypothetical protein